MPSGCNVCNLRHDSWWSCGNFSNHIIDADEACRSSEIFVNLIIISLFVDLLLFLLHFNIFFWYRCANILDVYLSFLFVCTVSITLVSDPTSRRFIRWLLFQTYIYIYIYNVWKTSQRSILRGFVIQRSV